MRLLVETIREHNAAWRAWFDAQGVEPHAVTYEQLVGDRLRVIQGIAARLAVELPGDWRPQSPHRKQADGLNRAWADALRASTGR
jgi:LPS sulfotransferase NodH